MFRKIYLKYFPQEENNKLSPIFFHLKLINPKLLYGLSIKYGIENRRVIWLDTRFETFTNHNLVFNDIKKESKFYSYKCFSSLNWFDNYNIYTIAPSITLLALNTYYPYLSEKDNLSSYINPILYSIDYIIYMFFSRFKQYESQNDSENLKYMIKLIESTIKHLEYTKSGKENFNKKNKFIKELIEIINYEPDFLLTLYKITKKLAKINDFWNDIELYKHFIIWNMLDFQKIDEMIPVLNKNAKKVFINKNSLYIDIDIITMLNIIRWDNSYINYISNTNNEDFLDYFIDAIDYINEINHTNCTIEEIIDNVLNLKKLWENLIWALKEYNTDNIDIEIEQNLWQDAIKELMNKETMENIKKVSSINEQFLDYFIFLINRKLNRNWDKLQNELLYNNYINKNENKYEIPPITILKYELLDEKYYKESYFYKNKKNIEKTSDVYSWKQDLIKNLIYIQNLKVILEDFNKKTHIEYIENKDYFELLKKYFKDDIQNLMKWIENNYLNKYFKNIFSDYKIEKEQLINFRNNIYYPDFIVFYEFCKFFKIKVKKENIIHIARIRESLFGYMILQNTILYSKNIEESYDFWCLLGDNKYDFESFFYMFIQKYNWFIDFFSNIKQNKDFINLILEKDYYEDTFSNSMFIYENIKDINYYNKRLFKF